MQTSTAVMQRLESPGNMQALPSGSGILAIKTSPGLRNVQPNSMAFSYVRYRLDLFPQDPSPMSASCTSRTSPSGSWSLLTTQSPSVNTPSVSIISPIVARVHPGGSSSAGKVANRCSLFFTPPTPRSTPSAAPATRPQRAAWPRSTRPARRVRPPGNRRWSRPNSRQSSR